MPIREDHPEHGIPWTFIHVITGIFFCILVNLYELRVSNLDSAIFLGIILGVFGFAVLIFLISFHDLSSRIASGRYFDSPSVYRFCVEPNNKLLNDPAFVNKIALRGEGIDN